MDIIEAHILYIYLYMCGLCMFCMCVTVCRPIMTKVVRNSKKRIFFML